MTLKDLLRKMFKSEMLHPAPYEEPAPSTADPYQMLQQVIPQFQVAFFSQIKESGHYEGIPFVRLFNGDILFGYSNPNTIYFKQVFDNQLELFRSLGLQPACFGAAFDALISYHHENTESWTVRKSHFIPKDGVVIDVGVRGGHFLVKAARLVGEHGRVVAIDATDFSERFVNLHTIHNRLSNVSFVRSVVGDKDGKETEFYYGTSGETFSGIKRETRDGEGKTVVQSDAHAGSFRACMQTVDTIARSLRLTRCDLVIMQINGGEVLAIKGMVEILKLFRPVLFISAFQREPGGPDPAEEILRFCATYSYRIFLRQKSGVILIPEVTSEQTTGQPTHSPSSRV